LKKKRRKDLSRTENKLFPLNYGRRRKRILEKAFREAKQNIYPPPPPMGVRHPHFWLISLRANVFFRKKIKLYLCARCVFSALETS
jgi:hypothetical protein